MADEIAQFESCKRKAEAGNPNEQFNLGNMLLKGKGCQINKNEAFRWFQKSANQNYSLAQFMLGNMLRSGEGCVMDKQKAMEMYEKSALKGNFHAQFNLATMYLHGKGCAVDYPKAIHYFQEAAFQGHDGALFALGDILREGKICPKDEATAFEMLKKSASAGLRNAQNSLGYMYEKGLGCTQDFKKAFELYLFAANQGNTVAQFRIGLCYKKGVGCVISENMYIAWFRKATVDKQKVAQVLTEEEHQEIKVALDEFYNLEKIKQKEIASEEEEVSKSLRNANTDREYLNLVHEKKKRALETLKEIGEKNERANITILSALARFVEAKEKQLESQGELGLAKEYKLVSQICSMKSLQGSKVFLGVNGKEGKPGKTEETNNKYNALAAEVQEQREKLEEYRKEIEKREKEIEEREAKMKNWFKQQEEIKRNWAESCSVTAELISSVYSV